MDWFSFSFGAFLGAIGIVFGLGAAVSIENRGARNECQAKLKVTECVLKQEWVAKP